jgi:hypothetical protein
VTRAKKNCLEDKECYDREGNRHEDPENRDILSHAIVERLSRLVKDGRGKS